MSNPVVKAVMRVTVEVDVAPIGANQTLAQLHEWAKKEAENSLDHVCSRFSGLRRVGKAEFVKAVVE